LAYRAALVPVALAICALYSEWEMYQAFRVSGHRPNAYCAAAFALLMYPVYWWRGLPGLIAAYLILTALDMALIILLPSRSYKDILLSAFLMFYPNLGYMCFLLINEMSPPELGFTGLAFALGVAGATDIAAFLGGSLLGKHKLVPEISPKKTVEGAFAGIVGGILASIFFWWLLRIWGQEALNVRQCMLTGFVVSLFAQMGDLVASCVKRYAGVKDFGKILGSHGGVMDRMDSTVMAAVAVYSMFTILF